MDSKITRPTLSTRQPPWQQGAVMATSQAVKGEPLDRFTQQSSVSSSGAAPCAGEMDTAADEAETEREQLFFARYMLDTGHFGEGFAIIKRAYKKSPDDLDSMGRMAYALLRCGHWQQARAIHDKILASDLDAETKAIIRQYRKADNFAGWLLLTLNHGWVVHWTPIKSTKGALSAAWKRVQQAVA